MQAAASPLDRFQTLTQQAWESGQLVKLVLANPHGADQTLLRVMARPVELKGQLHWSVLYRHQTKDITKNYQPAEGLAVVMAMVGVEGFRNAHLHTPTQEIQLAFSKKGKPTLRTGKVDATDAAESPQQGHNREKHRFLTLDRPFLRELGVTDAGGHLIPAMSRKWKQINKFIEVFDAAVQKTPLAQADAIHVADFGSGKGYLTFAMHDYIQHSLHKQAKVTGVELRNDLVELCGQVIQKLGLKGMAYEQGDVRDYQPTDLDVMIALHACDIATDYAIHLGIRSGAQIILCSPCCHKQIRPQLLSPHPLRPILQHGIHLGQEAEMLTDGLRALLLEAAGYDTQVFEFISLEHTNKNKMILGVKRARAQDNAEVVRQIAEIKAFYGIREQALEGLLRQDGLLAA